MAPNIDIGPVTKRAYGNVSIEIRPADNGWLVLSMHLSEAQADALLTLLLVRIYKLSEADVEIALTTLASLSPDEQVTP